MIPIITLDTKKLGKLTKSKSSISKNSTKRPLVAKRRSLRFVKKKSTNVSSDTESESSDSKTDENSQSGDSNCEQDGAELTPNKEFKRDIGPLSHMERAEKIYKFLVKKKQKHL